MKLAGRLQPWSDAVSKASESPNESAPVGGRAGAARRYQVTLLASVVLTITAAACSDVSEDVTPTAQCVSGRKWIAGDMGHEEMHPGSNCLQCHLDNAGPPLAIGGTLYAVPQPLQEEDCYGVEGATVTITDANGEVFTLETNAAGNFYLEGDPSTVAKPFGVVVEGSAFQSPLVMRPMVTMPETGACASCHGVTDPPDTARLQWFNISLGLPVPTTIPTTPAPTMPAGSGAPAPQ